MTEPNWTPRGGATCCGGFGHGRCTEDNDGEIARANSAAFSPDRVYRYSLHRQWANEPPVVFVLLNPSTADETKNDPTIRRCMRYAKDWGYGGVIILNLYAYRATDPRVMRRFLHDGGDIVGPENDTYIARLTKGQDVVAAWGNHADWERASGVEYILRVNAANLSVLKQNANSSPAHPLYLSAQLRPYPWTR